MLSSAKIPHKRIMLMLEIALRVAGPRRLGDG